MRPAVTSLDADGARQIQHLPNILDPGAGGHHDVVAFDAAAIGLHGGDGAAASALESGYLDSGQDSHALRFHLVGKAVEAAGIVGIAARLLVQNRRNSLGLPVVEHAAHVVG